MKQETGKRNIRVIVPIELKASCQEYFYALASSGKYRYLSFLDSSLSPGRYSNFSYIASEPDFAIKSSGKNNEVIFIKNEDITEKAARIGEIIKKPAMDKSACERLTLKENNPGKNAGEKIRTTPPPAVKPGGEAVKKLSIKANPLVFLRHILKIYTGPRTSGLYLDEKAKRFVDACNFREKMPDFTGGFIGYFSYDLKNYIERLPAKTVDDQKIPLFYLIYYPELLAYSHIEDRWFLISNHEIESGYIPGEFLHRVREEVEKRKAEIKHIFNNTALLRDKEIKKSIIKKYSLKKINRINLSSNFSRQDYLKAVARAKEYIHEGDIYQVNMTQRFTCEPGVDPHDLYYVLRQKNAAPFSAYLSFPEFIIGSSSPERFLFLKDNLIQTRPIKGTRPRGKNAEEDNKYINELKNSKKDRAELNMIVDLERNDLGKFCKYGTVKVKEHAIVEKYARVFHLVSTVTGVVQEGYDIVDIIRATFPGGSITGAPKIRAMEIIDELEPTARGVYTGAIGYIGDDLTMDLNIVIRTFIIKGNKFFYNVGGGIVEDSVPQDEYQETLDKGLALKETLEYFAGKLQ